MIFINEWLSNPTGADAKGEFIELWNNGNAPVNLNGWTLQVDSKKKFKLSGSIRANEYLMFAEERDEAFAQKFGRQSFFV